MKLSQTIKAPRSGSPHLVETIRQSILTGELSKGDRLQPVRQLATQFGISFETVRSALRSLEQEGMIVCRQGSGSFVTFDTPRTAQQVACDDVALWLRFHGHVFENMAAELLNGLQESGRFRIHTASWRGTAGVEQLKGLMARWGAERPRYIVLQWDQPGVEEAILEWIGGGKTPTQIIAVFRNDRLLPAGWHSVSYDASGMGQLAANYLLDQGHQRIGFVTYSRMVRADWKHTLRKATEPHTPTIQAIGHAMRNRGIRGGLHVHYVIREPKVGHQDPPAEANTPKNQELLMDWLSRADRPTAIIGDDTRLMGVKVAAEKMGLDVPRDLTLIGLGNTPWSVAGQFPSVAYGEELVARQIVKLIEAQEAGMDGTTVHLTVPPRIVMR